MGHKRHLHSFAGLTHIDFNERGHSYEHLLTTTLRVCPERAALLEVYRRACFNVLAHNQDDHPKNFAFTLSPGKEFIPSPAFDLVFTETEDAGGHWMSINGQNLSIRKDDLIRLGEKFNLRNSEIQDTLGAVIDGVARFEQIAKEEQLGSGWTHTIKQRLAAIRNRVEGR